MQIREVGFKTNPPTSDDEYVELQMYSDGQNLVGGHQITFYDQMGNVISGSTFTFAGNVPSGQSQRTILVGQSAVSPSPDGTVASDLPLNPSGGAVCFDVVDCVSWGTFPLMGSTPSATGTPESGATAGLAIQRDISGGSCPSALDVSDDTNQSDSDFNAVTRAPRNNAMAPTETLCTQLQVLRTGTGTGSVSGNGTPAIVCPSTCSAQFTTSDTAMLTATPASGSAFGSWASCPTPSGNTCSAPMSVSRSITATFNSLAPVPVNPGTPAAPKKKCKKGQKLKKGKCVKKKSKKK